MWNEKNINIYMAVFFGLLVMGLLFHQSQTFAGSALGHSLGIIGSIFILMTLIYPFRKRILKKRGKQNPLNNHIRYGLIGASLVVIHSAHKFSSLIGILIFLSLVLVVLSGIVGRYLFKKVNRSLKELKQDHDLLKSRIKSRQQELLAICKFDDSDSITGDDMTDNASGALSYSSDTIRFCIGGGDMTGSASGALSVSPEIMDERDRWIGEVRALAETEYNLKFFDRLKTSFTKWLRIHHTISVFFFAMMIVHVMTTLYYGLRWLP